MLDTVGAIASIVGAVTLVLVAIGRVGRRLPFLGYWRRPPDPTHLRRFMIASAVPGAPGLALLLLSLHEPWGVLLQGALPLLAVAFVLAVHACQPGREWWRTVVALVAVAAGGGIWLLAAERGSRSGVSPVVFALGIMLGAVVMGCGMWVFDSGPRHPDFVGPDSA